MPLPTFQAINSLEGAAYLDNIQGDRAASAGIAIHMAWLEHSSSFEFYKSERLLPDTPVDMLLLYKAMAATFEHWPPAVEGCKHTSGGQVMNCRKAEELMQSLSDPKHTILATLFVSNVIRFSTETLCEQDLSYLLNLFLRCIQQDGMIERIVSGEIKKMESQLADPDYW